MSSWSMQSNAQAVSWTFALDRAEVQAGNGFFVARVKAKIADGYHLYSLTQSPGGPTPTSITVAAGQPFAVQHVDPWPQPVRLFDPKFGMETEHHAGDVLFDVGITAAAEAKVGRHELMLDVVYQLCDDRTCLRPQQAQLRTTIKVSPGTAPGAPVSPGTSGSMVPRSSMERFQQFAHARPGTAELLEEVRRILDDDPKFTLGYQLLAKKPAARGDFRNMKAILRQGIAAGAERTTLEFALVGCGADPARRRRRLQRFVRRFPRTPFTAAALQDLAATARTRAERVRCLRRAMRIAGQTQALVLRELCPLLAETSPRAASQLANDVARRISALKLDGFFAREVTSALAKFYGSTARIDSLLREGNASAALRAVQGLTAPEVPHFGVNEDDKAVLRIIRARVLAASGRQQHAYAELIRDPEFLIRDELIKIGVRLGRELGKSRATVEHDAWCELLNSDHPTAEFAVPHKSKTLTADDFRAKVLLVSIWNPG